MNWRRHEPIFRRISKESHSHQKELAFFKKEKDALFMLHWAFVQGWRLGLKMMIQSLENYDVYEKGLSDNIPTDGND